MVAGEAYCRNRAVAQAEVSVGGKDAYMSVLVSMAAAMIHWQCLGHSLLQAPVIFNQLYWYACTQRHRQCPAWNAAAILPRPHLQVIHLKQELAVVLQADALSIGQSEELVVVHHTIHVLHPHSVHISVKDEVPVQARHAKQEEAQVGWGCRKNYTQLQDLLQWGMLQGRQL
jgi:hypothetical protein